MPKQTFRLRKNLILNILLSFSSVTLTLFGFLIVSPLISESTHAEGDEPDDGITITVNGEVDANLVLFDEGDYKIAKDTVSVSSSAAYGYELFLTTDSEAHQSIYLNDDPTSESRIAPVSGTIAEPAALTSNTWGFAIAGQGNFDNEYDPSNPDPASRFAIIPTEDTKQTVYENNAATAEDNIDFYYGIKVGPTLETGEYTTSAIYTAVAFSGPRVARAILGDNGNLNFVYDRNEYVVGNTYTDNLGEATVANIYEVPMDAYIIDTEEEFSTEHCPTWIEIDTIYSANFDSSFYDFKPTSTSCWFYYLSNLASVTNADKLNTGDVADMRSMFEVAGENVDAFSLDLGSWNTGNVVDMHNMFSGAGLNAATWSIGDLESWDISNVTNMHHMFDGAGCNAATWSIGDLSSWNTSSVTDMGGTFAAIGCNVADFDIISYISNWDTSNVTDMSWMFSGAGYNATTFNMDYIGGWDTSNVTNMLGMFAYAGYNATTLNLDLGGWDTSNVTDMSRMFDNAGYGAVTFELNLGGWDTSNVTDMSLMFENAGYSANAWNVGSLGYVDATHPGWDTSNVTDMSCMFENAGYNATIWDIGDIDNWNTGNVTDMSRMFNNSGYNATIWNIGNIGNWDVGKIWTHYNFINLNTYQSNASAVNNQPHWN